MTRFYYKAVNRSGDVSEGVIDAEDRLEVVSQLQRRGFIPIRAEAHEAEEKNLFRRILAVGRARGISQRDEVLFTDELATLLDAGLELERALAIIAEASENDSVCALIAGLRTALREGRNFSDALAARSDCFSPVYVNLVRAAEAAGSLGPVMLRLADYQNRMLRIRESLVSAMIYPAVLLGVAGLSAIFILAFVLPEFQSVFIEMGAALPLLTRVVMSVGEFIQAWWWLLLTIGVGVFWYTASSYRNPTRRRSIERFILNTGGIGAFVRQWEVARFSRTLSVLVENGVPIAEALHVANATIGNLVIADATRAGAERFRIGVGFANAMAETGAIPGHAIQMFRVGEETGEMGKMLAKTADVCDRQVNITVQRLLALIEPTMIIGLAALIAVLVLSLLLAVLGMNDLPL